MDLTRIALVATEDPLTGMPVWRDAHGREPRLVVLGASVITVELTFPADSVHAFAVDGVLLTRPIEGDHLTAHFVSPADRDLIEFECPVHPETMQGAMRVAPRDGALARMEGAVFPDAVARTVFELEAHSDGHAFVFREPGSAIPNPVLHVPPATEVSVTLRVVSGVHNLRIGELARTSVAAASTDAAETISFVSPANGTVEYWCDPHKATGHRGSVQVRPRWLDEAPTRALRAIDAPLEQEARVGDRLEWTNDGPEHLAFQVVHEGGAFVGAFESGGHIVALATAHGDLVFDLRLGDGAVQRHLVHVRA